MGLLLCGVDQEKGVGDEAKKNRRVAGGLSGVGVAALRALASPAADVGREPKARKKISSNAHGGRM
jgi:hypothetical protein